MGHLLLFLVMGNEFAYLHLALEFFGPPYISPVRQCLRYIRTQDYSRNSRITGTQTSLTTSLIQRIPPPNIRIVESGEAFRSPNHTADNVQITQPPLGILVDRRTSRNWLKTS
ncbi:hypothetical protein BGZ57DRAFT_867841 [Hyaloscypha finlandica]|nr:hypothetical protein BGZ57DRAFT_867841 [Hyaloscypha finlandica]